MHPLKRKYLNYIENEYGCWTNNIKIDEEKVVQFAQKVLNIGVAYDEYIKLACTVCEPWIKDKGWKYPYWHIISSDFVLERVARLVALESTDTKDDSAKLFDMELEYAIGIIAWIRGESEKPQHIVDVSANIKIKVAEYICMLAGKECTTSNYIVLARILND